MVDLPLVDKGESLEPQIEDAICESKVRIQKQADRSNTELEWSHQTFK